MDIDLTHDAFLGGRLHLWQPRKGYRAGVDPVLLAASVKAKAGQTVLDLGCGVGAAALCLGARVPDLILCGVERDSLYAELAARNGLNVVNADFTDLPASLKCQSFDHVLANPPYFDRSKGHASPEVRREAALGEETALKGWVDAATRRLKPKGFLHMIHRAERLPDLLGAVDGRLGSIEVIPLYPRRGNSAELIIFKARKEGRAPFVFHRPIIMHSQTQHTHDTPDYTPEIAHVLRDAAELT